MPQFQPAGPDSERGRGLAIMTALAWANGITVHPDSKTISFTLAAPPHESRKRQQPEIDREAGA